MTNRKQKSVILIDDDTELLESVQECLALEGNYNITVTTSAEGIIDELTSNKYDVIVCDIQMPIINGFELLKKFRENNSTIPFIVFTVTEDKQTVLKAFSLGANGFVGKFGKPEVIFSTLSRCIEAAINSAKNKKQN